MFTFLDVIGKKASLEMLQKMLYFVGFSNHCGPEEDNLTVSFCFLSSA